MESLHSFFLKYRFEILGLLLTFVLFGSAITNEFVFDSIIMPVSFIVLTLVAAVMVEKRNKYIRYIYLGISLFALFVLIMRILNNQQRELELTSLLVFILFFALLSFEVFRQMIEEKKVSRSIVIAAFDCYLLLGLMGSMLFTLIIAFDAHAFINVEPDSHVFDKMLYFSFITLTSIGYGDISPNSQIAEKFTALFGLVGHFYSVVIVGIIVGKYVSFREPFGKEK